VITVRDLDFEALETFEASDDDDLVPFDLVPLVPVPFTAAAGLALVLR
jgi:hypothetical protein